MPIVLGRRSGSHGMGPVPALHLHTGVHDERHLLLDALPCRLSGTVILPCLALLRAACTYTCGSLTLWGSRMTSLDFFHSLAKEVLGGLTNAYIYPAARADEDDEDAADA